MKKIHIVMTQDKKIWVFGSPSEASNLLNGEKAKCKVERNIDFLSRFLKNNKDVRSYILKGIGYWITCEYFAKKEDVNQYGILKRKLQNFGGKNENLLKGIRGEVRKISREMKHKLQHIEDQPPRYVRKTRVNSRPRV